MAALKLTARHANVLIYLTGEHWVCFISSRRSSSSQLDSRLDEPGLKSRGSKLDSNCATVQMLWFAHLRWPSLHLEHVSQWWTWASSYASFGHCLMTPDTSTEYVTVCMCRRVRESHWACGYAGMHVNMYYGVTMIEIITRIKTIPLFYLSAFGCSVESRLAVRTYWLSWQNKLQSSVYRIEALKVQQIASNMLEMYHGLWLAKKLILKLFLTCIQSTQVDHIFNRPDVLTMLSLHSFSSDFLTLFFF